jgi:hypothetical protein
MKYANYSLQDFEMKLNNAYGEPTKNKGNIKINVYKNGTVNIQPHNQFGDFL